MAKETNEGGRKKYEERKKKKEPRDRKERKGGDERQLGKGKKWEGGMREGKETYDKKR